MHACPWQWLMASRFTYPTTLKFKSHPFSPSAPLSHDSSGPAPPCAWLDAEAKQPPS